MGGRRLDKALQVGCQHVPAHFGGHPFRLQQGVHRQAVQCGEQPLRFRDQELVTKLRATDSDTAIYAFLNQEQANAA